MTNAIGSSARRFAAMASFCLALNGCDRFIAAPELVISSERCALSTKALQRLIREESPALSGWTLDPAQPRTMWQRDFIVPQAELEDAGTQTSFNWRPIIDRKGTFFWRSKREEELPANVRGPSLAMAEAFAAASPISGASCPEMRAYASAQDALPPPRSSDRATRISGPSDFWLVAELAVISPDGKEAIVAVDMHSVGTLVYYRRAPDGSWRDVAATHSWVS